MKRILFIVFIMISQFVMSQPSYVVVEAQYDSWGPQESSFYITNNQGDTIYQHTPTQPQEYRCRYSAEPTRLCHRRLRLGQELLDRGDPLQRPRQRATQCQPSHRRVRRD